MSPFFTAFISPGGSEFLLIMLVLILLFGAKDAPRIFRSIHNALDKMQRAAASFRYKIMYGDLYQDTTSEEPYDVEANYPDDDPDGHWETDEPEETTEPPEDRDQESDDRGQKAETREQESGNKNQKTESPE